MDLSDTKPALAVYVIDDNARMRRSLNRLLTLSNWTVRTFDSGEAFLAELSTLSRGCIVVDIELKGMSGIELVRRITDSRLAWPIIVMSGSVDNNAESDVLRLGARAYLRKPFDMQALINAIAALQ
jgi:two-component system response regulator FixJ